MLFNLRFFAKEVILLAYDGSIRIDTSIDGEGFSSGLKKISSMAGTAVKGVTTLIAGAAAALSAGALAGVKYNAQMEQYITSFGTMLGGAEKAQGMISELKSFAAETPFEMTDLAKGAQTLLAFGTAQEKVLPVMKMIGDVSQGNKEKFDSLTLAFSQISSTGKLTGQDLLQCINAGFNPLNEISKKTGKSMAELKDEMSKGAISADMVTDAFKQATSEGGQFFNAMESQSQTFNGQLSTLKDNAISFIGELTEDFSDKLKDTALPMVNTWLSDMQGAFKAGGPDLLAQTVGDVISSASLAAAEQAPGVIESASKVVESFANGLLKNSGKICGAGIDIVKALVNGIADIFPEEISQPIKDGAEAIEKSLRSGGLKKGFETFQTLLSGSSMAVGNIAKAVLPPFIKTLDLLADNLHIIAPAATAVVTAITAWKVVQQAQLWIASFKAAVTVTDTAVKAFAMSQLLSAEADTVSTAALTLSQLAHGVLTGQIGLATAAQTLFNGVLNANPVGLVVTAVAALTAGLVLFCAATYKSKEATEKANRAGQAMADGFKDFVTGVENASSRLSEFDGALSGTSEANSALQQKIDECQSEITRIYNEAIAERVSLLDEERLKIEEHTQNLKELYDQQLENESLKAEIVKNNLIAEVKNFQGSASDYAALYQGHLATLRELNNNKITLINQQTSAEMAEIQRRHTEENTMNSAAYDEEMKTALERKDAKLEGIKSENTDFFALSSQKYTQLTDFRSIYEASETEQNAASEAEKARHDKAIDDLNNTWWTIFTDRNGLIEAENATHNANMKTIYSQGVIDLTDTQQRQSGVMLGMAVEANEKGLEIDNATKEVVGLILDSWDKLPQEGKNTMAQTLQPMLDDMGIKGEDLANASEEVGLNIISRLKEALGVHSPSWKTREALDYVMQGAEQGLEGRRSSLLGKAASIAQGIIDTISRAFDIRSPSHVMKDMFGYVMAGAEKGLSENELSLLRQAKAITQHVFEALTPNDIISFNAEARAAVAQSHAAMTMRYNAQAEYDEIKHRPSKPVSEADKRKAAAPQSATIPITVTAELDGREVFKNQQTVKSSFGYPIGGTVHEW